MPVVNPAVLAERTKEIAGFLGDPDGLTRACLDLLEYYADRMKRPGVSSKDVGVKALNVPRPVLRALSSSFQQAAQGQANLAVEAAWALWEVGYRETRLLAATLIGTLDTEEIPNHILEMAGKTSDADVHRHLAENGLREWLKTDREVFIEWIDEILQSSRRRIRQFALIALETGIQQRSFEDLPGVFRILRKLPSKVRREARQTYYELMRALARRSPAETTRFLRDDLEHDRSEGLKTIRATIQAFPSRQRKLLEIELAR